MKISTVLMHTTRSLAFASFAVSGAAYAATQPLKINFDSGPYATTSYDLAAPFANSDDEIGPYDTKMGASGSVTLDVSSRTGSDLQEYKILEIDVSDGLFESNEVDELDIAEASAAIDDAGDITIFDMILGWFGIGIDASRALEVSTESGTSVYYTTEYFGAEPCGDSDTTCVVLGKASTPEAASVEVAQEKKPVVSEVIAKTDKSTITPVPLPGALPLLFIGVAGFAAVRRARRS